MKKSRLFWQDVELAICTLMFRQLLHQIIVEGRNIRQPSSEINNSISTIQGRDHGLFRYYELMMARFHNHSGHMHI
jgi:hypothetical protein